MAISLAQSTSSDSCRIKESHNDFAMESFQIISFGNQFEHIKRQFDG